MWLDRSLHPYFEVQPDPDKYFSTAMTDLIRYKCQIQIPDTTEDLIEACDRALQELNPDWEEFRCDKCMMISFKFKEAIFLP